MWSPATRRRKTAAERRAQRTRAESRFCARLLRVARPPPHRGFHAGSMLGMLADAFDQLQAEQQPHAGNDAAAPAGEDNLAGDTSAVQAMLWTAPSTGVPRSSQAEVHPVVQAGPAVPSHDSWDDEVPHAADMMEPRSVSHAAVVSGPAVPAYDSWEDEIMHATLAEHDLGNDAAAPAGEDYLAGDTSAVQAMLWTAPSTGVPRFSQAEVHPVVQAPAVPSHDSWEDEGLEPHSDPQAAVGSQPQADTALHAVSNPGWHRFCQLHQLPPEIRDHAGLRGLADRHAE